MLFVFFVKVNVVDVVFVIVVAVVVFPASVLDDAQSCSRFIFNCSFFGYFFLVTVNVVVVVVVIGGSGGGGGGVYALDVDDDLAGGYF